MTLKRRAYSTGGVFAVSLDKNVRIKRERNASCITVDTATWHAC